MSDQQTQTEETSTKAKRTRGPRSPLTAGDIVNAMRFAKGRVADVRAFLDDAVQEHGEEVVTKALATLAKDNPELSASLGYVSLPKDEAMVDFRNGIFLSLKELGAVKGSIAKLERTATSVTVTLK